MTRRARRSIGAWVYGGSVVLHAALAVATVVIPKPDRAPEPIGIRLAEIRKKNAVVKAPPPPPPPPPPEKPKPPPPPPKAQAQAKTGAEPAKEEAPPEPTGPEGFAELGGVALGNGGGEGVALAGPAHAASPSPAGANAKPAVRKVEKLALAAQDAASSAVFTYAKAKVRFIPKKEDYPLKALQAEIEGVVMVEVTIDETGKVIVARVLSGLGYGLDEVAISYAKKWIYEPALRGDKPVISTKKIPFRFSLQ